MKSMYRNSLLVNLFGLLLCSACSNKPKEIPVYTKDFCSEIHIADSSGLEKELVPFADSMRDKTGIYVLEDGGNAMMVRAWLSEHAEKTIDIQYFIFSTDNVGLIACDYIVRAADRGVKVRILIDDMMVDATPHDILTLDSHKNIEVKIYNPGVNLGKNLEAKVAHFAKDFKGANQRMHNKTFTVDGKVVVTGGRNIADEYFDYDHEYNFRDRDVLLLGKVVGDVHSSFETFWNSSLSVPVTKVLDVEGMNFTDSNRFERLHQYACNPDNFWPQVRAKIRELPEVFKSISASGKMAWSDSVYFVADDPGKNTGDGMHGGGKTTTQLAGLIAAARSTIDIQSPYLIVTDEGLQLFKAAVKRGVRVRIMTNSLASTDNLPAFAGYQKVRKQLLDAGVHIYEFKPDAKERYNIMTGALQQKLSYTPVFGLHAKSMVVDGAIAVVGTFNMDPRSANLNSECVTIVHSRKVAEGILRGMEEEYKPENSWETTVAHNPDSEAGAKKRIKTFTKRVIPKNIL